MTDMRWQLTEIEERARAIHGPSWDVIGEPLQQAARYRAVAELAVGQRDEELRERRKQGVGAMIRVFQDERGAIELTEWGPRFYRLLDAALDSIFEEAD